MLFHDDFWRQELSGYRDEIAKMEVTGSTNHEGVFLAQRPLYYSAFIVRKLIEDAAVTDVVAATKAVVQASQAIPGAKFSFVSHKIGIKIPEFFDISKSSQMEISYSDLASEVMHANGFLLDIDVPKGRRLLVYSYRNTKKRLLWVTVDAWIEMLDKVLADVVKDWWTEIDEKGYAVLHAK